jgi:hypothetical protein
VILILLWVGSIPFLIRLVFHLVWIFEYKSDEAAVRNFGTKASIDMFEDVSDMNTGFSKYFPSHLPIDKRKKRIKEIGEKLGKPLIDFDELERNIPQVFEFKTEEKVS